MGLGLVHVFLVFALLFWGHLVEAGAIAADEVIVGVIPVSNITA